MYHHYKKNSSYLREALYKAYDCKCVYCSETLELRHMHVDHILPTNKADINDEEVKQYIEELEKDGFIQDSIENYLPVCSACNLKKSNHVFKVSNLRYYHEIARKHLARVLSDIERIKGKNKEFFYEPVDLSVWEELSFNDQRDLSHAIMGYRLTSMDVEACPIFPQVNTTENQLKIVDYVVIQGETGCGKSISLYQVAYRFFKNGWSVYLLQTGYDGDNPILPDNTEKSLFLIDDAQTLPDSLRDHFTRQSRFNRKVLFARTISDKTNSDSIILAKKDAVNILYKEFLNKKEEVWPIVKLYDNTIGVNFSDLPIERRLEDARKADTPWQFSYILRGGWRSMKELYKSICDHNDCDLLVAAIATFQILQLDKAVDFNNICKKIQEIEPNYKWSNCDLELLINRRIVLSKDDTRIVHMESANVIIALFFDNPQNEKQTILLKMIEDAFINKEISPLGIVWLCNGCNRYINHYWRIEDRFLTDRIIENVSMQLYEPQTSEDARNIMYLLEKILVSGKKEKGIQIILENRDQIIEMIDRADSISAWGFSELLNSLYNYDHKKHNSISSQISWDKLMDCMMHETAPNYYSWGRLFNRGLSLLEKNRYSNYSDKMYTVIQWLIPKATVFNIEGITAFLSSVSFLNHLQIHTLFPALIPVYKQFFENNTEQAIHLVNWDFMWNICGMDLFEGKKSRIESANVTAKEFVDVIPEKKLADVISNSSVHEWLAIRDILYFIFSFDKKKYNNTVKQIDLNRLSDKVKNSWDQSHEISLILEFLTTADSSIAKAFLAMNEGRVTVYYPVMVSIDPKSAIKANKEKNVKLDLFTEHHWDYKLAALKALYAADECFCVEYLRSNIPLISEVYSNVCALDFIDRNALDFLKELRKIDTDIYHKTIAGVNSGKVLKRWDQCGGINPRKTQWVKRSKREFFEMLGVTSELEVENCK